MHGTQKGEADAAWRARWERTVAETAGIAPYLKDGADYVEDVRGGDAESLSRLAGRAPSTPASWWIT